MRLRDAMALTAEAVETAIRTYDEAEQKAAQFDWSGSAAVSTLHQHTTVHSSGVPLLNANVPALHNSTGGFFRNLHLPGMNDGLSSPSTMREGGSGVATRVVDGVLQLEPGFGGGAVAGISLLTLLGILYYHSTILEEERQRLAQNSIAITVLAIDAHVRAVARRKGISQQCLHDWSDYIHDVKEEEGRRGDDNFTDPDLERLADQFLQERPRCRGR